MQSIVTTQRTGRRTCRAPFTAIALASAMLAAPAWAADGDVSVTLLHQFTGVSSSSSTVPGEGMQPYVTPIYNAADQKLYGGAHGGGYRFGSVVWSLNPALPAQGNGFITQNTPSQTRTGFGADGNGNFLIGRQGTAVSFPASLLATAPTGEFTELTGSNYYAVGLFSTASDGSVYFGGGTAVSIRVPQIYRYANGQVTTIEAGFTADHQGYIIDSVISDDSGILYGVMKQERFGGSFEAPESKEPFLFRLDPAVGTYEKIADFSAETGYPTSTELTAIDLIDGGDGWLYGSTLNSSKVSARNPTDETGTVSATNNDHLGKVYRISKTAGTDGAYAVEALHTFTGAGGDGAGASGHMVKANDGNIYGTTLYGGANGAGTIWRIVFDGDSRTFEQVYSLSASEGSRPTGLSQGEDYVLYGAARAAGGSVEQFGTATDTGTAFKVELPKPAAVFTNALAADKTSITAGEGITLTWLATNVQNDTCTASGAWLGDKPADSANAASSDTTVTLSAAGTQTLTLTCVGINGQAVSSAVDVLVEEESSGGGGSFTPALALLPLLGAGWLLRRRKAVH